MNRLASGQVSCQAGINLKIDGHTKKITSIQNKQIRREKKPGKIIYRMIALLKRNQKYLFSENQHLHRQ